ncbi:putative peptidylprolyl isomerase transcription factor C2H2 family [Helianthus anomalus]
MLQTPCGHNFCLKCFEKWVGQGKRTCAICRTAIPLKSGGRDLSGNKRTNKTQSFDQKFDKSNEALRISCKKGYPGFKVCQYLFVRCDNDPAPWTSDENGDRPRPLLVIKELKDASEVTERIRDPHLGIMIATLIFEVELVACRPRKGSSVASALDERVASALDERARLE